jgi:hypothetical protein
VVNEESRRDLVDKTLALVDNHSAAPTPFTWVYDAETKAA